MLDQLSKKLAIRCFLFILGGIQSFAGSSQDYYTVTYHDHALLKEVRKFSNPYINKGRVQVVTLKKGVEFDNLPSHIKEGIEPIDPKILSKTPLERQSFERSYGKVKIDQDVRIITSKVSAQKYRDVVEGLVETGRRTNNSSTEYILSKLREYGYDPVHDYNIEAFKVGAERPDELVIIEGHMDTVSSTVGADDNASGAAAVIEAARVLKDISTSRSILFLITEDEEIGLLGAKRKVSELRAAGNLANVKFVVNMDMIGYNSNGIVDLETEPEFEPLTDWMAEQVFAYTSLKPNKVLNAWGSDHVPFIKAGVETLLTIEHWNTHTPCWHKSCDKLETINFDYALEIVKLNVAAITLKAQLSRKVVL